MKIAIILIFIISTIFEGVAQVKTLNVMPYPLEVTQGEGNFRINEDFTISINSAQNDKIAEEAANRFLIRLRKKTLAYIKQERVQLNQSIDNVRLSIQIGTKADPTIGVDESYHLSVTTNNILIKSNTSIGPLLS